MMRHFLATLAILITVVATFTTSAQAQPSFIAVYGNWCGPGHRSFPDGTPLPPVDSLDAACMRHDVCYIGRGDFDCHCDFVFLDELRRIPYPDPHSAELGRAMYDVISAIPCAGPDAALKPAYFMGQMLSDFLHGGPPPWNLPSRLGNLLSNVH